MGPRAHLLDGRLPRPVLYVSPYEMDAREVVEEGHIQCQREPVLRSGRIGPQGGDAAA
jgi:hypothetical protein